MEDMRNQTLKEGMINVAKKMLEDGTQLGNIEYRQPRAAGNQNRLRGFASDVL